MTDWIKASNPATPITTEADAIAAARASAIAIFLGAVWGIVGLVYMMTAGSGALEAAAAQAAADTPEMPGMANVVTQAALWMGIGLTVVQLIIGFVQWAKPNIVIPIIFVILVAFGLVTGVFGLVMAGQPEMAAAAAQTPMWQTVIGFVILAVQLVMHIAGIRGANKLDKIRMAAAQDY
ncbi:hypothetical protein GCM10009422_24180 [Brevundimonas kwangchunensis]|uniref:DUF4149 domain-containing protein n=1 Tax=Brevundimonas kwangchunensis TaxID=322163 RepID=A0ABN1H1P0_9CAUL